MDKNLSRDKKVACISCHSFESGADKRERSIGVEGEFTDLNSPTVFNSIFNFRQMWNGRVESLKEQVTLSLHSPKKMGIKSDIDILNYLRNSKEYEFLFKKVYNKSATLESFSDAIAEFEKALITPNSPFDRYLKKEHNLTPKEMAGYTLFKRLGCISCHNGINIGGNSYQKFGVAKNFSRRENSLDLYSLTLNPSDKNVFKVPTLRNVAKTAPYLHTGEIKTLKKVIIIMSEYNLGFKLSDDEVEKIEAFLKTLTGDTPKILKDDI
jgi:cytochrome c peroxidase